MPTRLAPDCRARSTGSDCRGTRQSPPRFARALLRAFSTRIRRMAAAKAHLQGEHPLADGPWVFRRQDLETEAAARLVQRVRSHCSNPAKARAEQGTPDLFETY